MVDGTFFLEKLSREREEATNSDNNIGALRADVNNQGDIASIINNLVFRNCNFTSVHICYY